MFSSGLVHSLTASLMDLSRYLLVDTSTGTVLTASTCVLLADHDLSSSEWEELDSCSDSEMCDIAKDRGRRLSDLLR